MRTRSRRFLVLFVSILPVCSSQALTLYVSQSGDGSDGHTWETAFTTIGAGMTASASGDEIVVATGTYFERVLFEGKDVVLRSTDPEDPLVVEATVIDASKAGSVVTFSGLESHDCMLSGFTITHGQAISGGGILGEGTLATLCHNLIEDNTATGGLGGGGLFACLGLIKKNTISGNRSITNASGEGGLGGGLSLCFDGRIQHNIITNNNAISDIAESGLGGGLFLCGGITQNNVIAGNIAVVKATTSSSIFGGGLGGGLFGCDGRIQNNLIHGNIASSSAGFALGEGSGGGLAGCSGLILNNTIYGNEASHSAGGMVECVGVIANCILWNNEAGDEVEFASSSTPYNCCIKGWTEEGYNNTAADPLLSDPEEDDFRLTEGSPCHDSGYLYLFNQDCVTDLDGNSRLAGDSVDRGCYEFLSSRDTDGDFLSDSEEVNRGTEVDNPDSDGDGLCDGIEVLRGDPPHQATAFPPNLLVPSEIGAIQHAIFLAYPGESITVETGVYEELVRFLGRDLHLRSSDPEDASVVQSTVLEGEGIRATVSFDGKESPNAILEGFSITGGSESGIRGERTNATIRGNDIYENKSLYGGGITLCHGLIEGNKIHYNSARAGGGISACYGTIRENSIHHNTATQEPYLTATLGYGGGLSHCAGPVQNNRIFSNTAYRHGGGVSTVWGLLENNLIYDNESETGGGVYYCYGGVRNNTIYGNRAIAREANSATGEGGGIAYCELNYSNIIWGNSAEVGPQIFQSDYPFYSFVEGWASGDEGNFSTSPLFVDPSAGDFHLQYGSPCIDTGAPIGPSLDFDGNPRPYDVSGLGRSGPDAFDIGAYESQAEPPPITICISVSGIVYNASLGMSHPVSGASVEFEAAGRPPDSVFYALTDEDGEFSNVQICEDEGSSLYVTVRAPGYAPYTRTVGTLYTLFNLPPLEIALIPTLYNGRSDLNGDDMVDARDLLILLSDWKKVTDAGR